MTQPSGEKGLIPADCSLRHVTAPRLGSETKLLVFEIFQGDDENICEPATILLTGKSFHKIFRLSHLF